MFTSFDIELPNSAWYGNTYGEVDVLGGHPRHCILPNTLRGLSAGRGIVRISHPTSGLMTIHCIMLIWGYHLLGGCFDELDDKIKRSTEDRQSWQSLL